AITYAQPQGGRPWTAITTLPKRPRKRNSFLMPPIRIISLRNSKKQKKQKEIAGWSSVTTWDAAIGAAPSLVEVTPCHLRAIVGVPRLRWRS
ncbi:MAG: hypothetical protein LIP02_05545, partial [Bacteroidales bacterium]|nr:hypothetical protein [Bacteroidales bacterium]